MLAEQFKDPLHFFSFSPLPAFQGYYNRNHSKLCGSLNRRRFLHDYSYAARRLLRRWRSSQGLSLPAFMSLRVRRLADEAISSLIALWMFFTTITNTPQGFERFHYTNLLDFLRVPGIIRRKALSDEVFEC